MADAGAGGADACLSEDMVAELTTCRRTNLDCATTCAAIVEVLSRHTGYDANIPAPRRAARASRRAGTLLQTIG